MPPNRSKQKYLICIICKKRKKRKGSLFCRTCCKKGVFIKINALRESRDYQEGWINVGIPQRGGRLPRKEW